MLLLVTTADAAALITCSGNFESREYSRSGCGSVKNAPRRIVSQRSFSRISATTRSAVGWLNDAVGSREADLRAGGRRMSMPMMRGGGLCSSKRSAIRTCESAESRDRNRRPRIGRLRGACGAHEALYRPCVPGCHLTPSSSVMTFRPWSSAIRAPRARAAARAPGAPGCWSRSIRARRCGARRRSAPARAARGDRGRAAARARAGHLDALAGAAARQARRGHAPRRGARSRRRGWRRALAQLALRVSRGDMGHAVFVAVRPPGHHAERDADGFRLLNNVVVAARRLLADGVHLLSSTGTCTTGTHMCSRPSATRRSLAAPVPVLSRHRRARRGAPR